MDELWSFMSDELDKTFKPMFPQVIATVKWKYDYVIFQKKSYFKKEVVIFFSFFQYFKINDDWKMPSSDQSKYDCSKYEKMMLFQLLCEYWELCEYTEDMLHEYDPYY